MKSPGPEHPIRIEPSSKRVVVTAGAATIADTRRAMVLHEADYPPVYYVPRADAMMALLERSERTTHCPYKGDASYYSIVGDGTRLENAVWTYEHPYAPAAPIAEFLAFYPDRVDIVAA